MGKIKKDKREEKDTAVYEPIFIARQPVFDKNMKVWGYELLFRHCEDVGCAQFKDSCAATSKVIIDGFSLAQSGISGKTKTMINFPLDLILDEIPYALPKGHVIELLEDIVPTAEILQICDELKNNYLLAVDDYTGQPDCEPLLEKADIIKVDVLNMDQGQIRSLSEYLHRYSAKLLAEKVESNKTYQLTKDLGFELFQGYFFSKPQIIAGRKLSTNQVSRMRILKELSKSDFDPQSLSVIIQSDVSISFRLLQYINSVGFGLVKQIKSIQHAIQMLGGRRIRQWLRVLIMADLNPTNRGQELVQLSATRGQFLQIMAQEVSVTLSWDSMFLIGLFSLLDAILDQPMHELLTHLPLDPEVSKTLMGEDTEAKMWLDLVRAKERGDWKRLDELLQEMQLKPSTVAQAYQQALRWSCDFLKGSPA